MMKVHQLTEVPVPARQYRNHAMATLHAHTALNVHVAASTSSPGRWISLSLAVGMFKKKACLEQLQTCICF
jgi:phage gp46-like protein